IKHVLSEVTAKFISYYSRLIWFHAGAAGRDGRAVLIIGPRGRGKSTLVTRLCAAGWTYLSDDITPVDPGSDSAYSFPTTPAVREDSAREIPLECLADVRKLDVEIRPESVGREAMPVAALIFPVYSLGAPCGLSLCSPAPAALELLGN